MKKLISLPSGAGPRRPKRPRPDTLTPTVRTYLRTTIRLEDARKIPSPDFPLVADAGLILDGQFVFQARILRDGQGKAVRLELDRTAFDKELQRDTLMPAYAESVLRDVFDIMYQQYLLAQARLSQRGAGRN